jgi:hypothetical protein
MDFLSLLIACSLLDRLSFHVLPQSYVVRDGNLARQETLTVRLLTF